VLLNRKPGVTRRDFLPFSPPSIGEEEIEEIIDTLRSDWITTGPKVGRFEEEFAAFVGASSSLALSSCTAALHVALAALGVGPGDAVLSTAMTFCSSVHVIEQVGARPVLVDVEPDTLNIDPEGVRAAASRGGRVKAILVTHLYGHPCEMDTILDVARRHDLAVIEDAAHALPARYKGRMIGVPQDAPGMPLEAGVTDVGPRSAVCFSFYATKNLTTAEGGMLTGLPDLVSRSRVWGLHGMSRDAWKRYSAEGSWHYDVLVPGFKYNMTDLQAAIGLQQLRKLEGFQARRRQIVRRYTEAFSEIAALQPPTERVEVEHAWHVYALRLNLEMLVIDRARFIEELRLRNIGASVHFIPIHLHSYYREKYGFAPGDFPIAHREYMRLVSLPVHPRMSDADVDDVISAVVDIADAHRR
jgi:dTDP-4-amino-4,6-dideoxygalactose transaminase